MATAPKPTPAPQAVVETGKRKWNAATPLPGSLQSRELVSKATQQITGMTEKEVRPLRKSLPCEGELCECVVLYAQGWMKDPELAKASANKVPTLDQLLNPPKGVLIRVRRKVKGQFVEDDAIGARELKRCMSALYLDFATNASLGTDGFYWVFLTLLNGKDSPIAGLMLEVAKNLHRGFDQPKKPHTVREWWVGESEANIEFVQPALAAK